MSSERDVYWMRRALVLAQKAADIGEVPVGALVIQDQRLVGEGWNQSITTVDPSAHAEIVALRAAGKQLNNYRMPRSTLYVTLEPCTMCLGALVHARVERLVFGAEEPKAGVVYSRVPLADADFFNHHIDYCGGVLAAECSALLSNFFKNRRKKT
ncbi:MAG: tRNA adenosine(34) deaminase TadA [Cellvibrionaceae bacterium]|nr:tRNA adenosine(34) deaminase TadA [Cellvibrionaceae bacterium]